MTRIRVYSLAVRCEDLICFGPVGAEPEPEQDLLPNPGEVIGGTRRTDIYDLAASVRCAGGVPPPGLPRLAVRQRIGLLCPSGDAPCGRSNCPLPRLQSTDTGSQGDPSGSASLRP